MSVLETSLRSPFQGGAPKIWLRDGPFDLCFIIGIAALALASGALVAARPDLFPLILFLDLWLLGYHHVIATFTRLAFDRHSLARHRFLVFGLPPLVIAGCVAAVLAAGPWLLASVYFYWQWFHYTRQSYGIARLYQRRADAFQPSHSAPAPDPAPAGTGTPLGQRRLEAAIYLLPLWGLLHRSHQDPGSFLGMELVVLPVPAALADLAALAALAALAWWGVGQWRAWRRGGLALGYFLYMLSHTAIFACGYLLIDDIDHGWLVLNIWHNAQYIAIVWLHNTRRFKSGPDPRHPFLSRLAQPAAAGRYLLVCLGIATLVYWSLGQALTWWEAALPLALPLAVVVYQAINFHHYLVDGMIWKSRARAAA